MNSPCFDGSCSADKSNVKSEIMLVVDYNIWYFWCFNCLERVSEYMLIILFQCLLNAEYGLS